MGNWDEAGRRKLEERLECQNPKCSAVNRPGATVIEVGPGNIAVCAVCRNQWSVGR